MPRTKISEKPTTKICGEVGCSRVIKNHFEYCFQCNESFMKKEFLRLHIVVNEERIQKGLSHVWGEHELKSTEKISHSVEKMSTTWNPCKTCPKKVKQPFMFCFDCNEKRRKLFTSTCATCSKKIKPDYPKCYSCFEKEKSESVVREPTTKPRIDLSQTINAPVYEPQTQSV